MTYAISDDFNDPRGRWMGFAPYDSTESFDEGIAFLTNQEHVDLRSFRVFSERVAVPQNPDLDLVTQSVLDALPQTDLETAPGRNLKDELWALTATGGTNNNLTVGKRAAYGGWSAAQFTTNGSALGATLESVIAEQIDISHETSLSMVFPDYHNFDTATSYIQLCSHGTFGAGHDSAQVHFNLNTSSQPHLKLALSGFAASGFDLTKVTGVRIHLVKASAPAAASVITIMAIRAIKSTWTESALDFDTRIGVVTVPVSLDGNPYAGIVAQNFEYVRGDGGKNDPIPADASINVYFYPGGEVANDATGTDYNKIAVILREKTDAGAGTGSHIEASILFNDTDTSFEAKRVDSTGGSPGTRTNHGVYDAPIGTALDPGKHYVFHIEIKGTRIDASLYETDINRVVGNFVWHLSQTLTDTNYVYRNGRVGFIADLITRDAYVDEISVSPTGFASLTTEIYESRSPVDGAQLAAIYASDENLWSDFFGSDTLIDQTKTVSGTGSYRTSKSLTTNTFISDDWTQTYLDLAIWVPSIVTLSNQPIILLNTPTDQEHIVMPRLQPAQWNLLHFDLGVFRNLLSGIGYSITIQSAPDPDKPLGNFWVDETIIGRRRVAWSARATSTGPFRQFRDLVNNPSGAIHFPANERGTQLQLRAEALTQDAWVSSFKLFPRYAQLGLPVYDQAFEKR